MNVKTSKFDPADYLETDEDVIGFLEDMAENGTPGEFLHGLRTAARSAGMTILADKLGVSRTSLYKSLAEDGNPSFATVYRVVQALGLRLSVDKAA